MTEQYKLEPTDDEIRKVAEKHYGTCMTAQELTFARAILAQFTQPTPDESDNSEDKWRDLALQFDEHRMQAIGWLQVCSDRLPERTAEVIKEFLKAPPLHGQKVLANRIAAMCPAVQPSAEPSHNEQNLAMAIKKVVSSARRHLDPTLYPAKRAEEAWALVQRLGLEGSALRAANLPGDSEINDSQQRILDAAMRWAEQREVGPTPAKEAWRSLTLRIQAELNYTAACAAIDAQPSDTEKDAARYRWLRDRNDWHAEPRLDEEDGTIWKLTFYTPAPIIDPTDDDSLDVALIAAMLEDVCSSARQVASQPAQPIETKPSNTGCGHVFPRPDGVRARCGGPGVCSACSKDAAREAAMQADKEK